MTYISDSLESRMLMSISFLASSRRKNFRSGIIVTKCVVCFCMCVRVWFTSFILPFQRGVGHKV